MYGTEMGTRCEEGEERTEGDDLTRGPDACVRATEDKDHAGNIGRTTCHARDGSAGQ
jgi:hypothetical protein